MQSFVPLHVGDVVTIQQPVHLLPGEGNHRVFVLGPLELFLGERFVVQHEAIVFPEDAFDLVALAIDENVQRAVKGVITDLKFDDGGQPPVAFSEIYGRTVQVDGRQRRARTQYRVHDETWPELASNRESHSAGGQSAHSRTQPLECRSRITASLRV